MRLVRLPGAGSQCNVTPSLRMRSIDLTNCRTCADMCAALSNGSCALCDTLNGTFCVDVGLSVDILEYSFFSLIVQRNRSHNLRPRCLCRHFCLCPRKRHCGLRGANVVNRCMQLTSQDNCTEVYSCTHACWDPLANATIPCATREQCEASGTKSSATGLPLPTYLLHRGMRRCVP